MTTVGDEKNLSILMANDGGALNLDVEAGRVRIGSTIYDIAAAVEALANNMTNYVFINSSGVLSSNTTGFPSEAIAIAEVVTSGGNISTITDKRAFCFAPSGMDNTEDIATADTSTTSTPYTQMDSMVRTPVAGTWLVMFSASGNLSTGPADGTYAIFMGASEQSQSERKMYFEGGAQVANFEVALHSQCIVVTTGSEVVEVKYKISTGTFTVHERSMILVKLA